MAKGVIASVGGVVIDVNDLERSAAFWGEVLGQEPGRPRSNGDYLTVGALEGATWLVLQRVPESKTVKNRIHLDFRVDNVNDAITRIALLGC